jgi:hypothetical protein
MLRGRDKLFLTGPPDQNSAPPHFHLKMKTNPFFFNVLNYVLNKMNMECVQDDVHTCPSTTIMVDSISHT